MHKGTPPIHLSPLPTSLWTSHSMKINSLCLSSYTKGCIPLATKRMPLWRTVIPGLSEFGCSRPHQVGLWATWSSWRYQSPWQEGWTRWSLKSLSTQTILLLKICQNRTLLLLQINEIMSLNCHDEGSGRTNLQSSNFLLELIILRMLTISSKPH